MLRLILAFALFLTFLTACTNDGERNIKAYYYPLEKMLNQGIVYEYEGLHADSVAPYFWYYQTVQLPDSPMVLVGTYYDANFQQRQLVREEVVGNGMLLQDMRLFLTDKSGRQEQVVAEILAPNVFPFEVSDSSGIFLYKVQWDDPFQPNSTTTLIRNRRYLGDTSYVFQGQSLPAVRLGVREIVENEQDGFLEIELEGEEWYAQNLGLVYTNREAVENPFRQEYALRDTFDMKRLENRFREQLEPVEK